MPPQNLAIDPSGVLPGEKSLSEGGGEIFERLIRVAGGEPSNAEQPGHREFGFHGIGPTL